LKKKSQSNLGRAASPPLTAEWTRPQSVQCSLQTSPITHPPVCYIHTTVTTSMHAISHNYATKSPLVTMPFPHLLPKLSLPLRRSPTHLIHPSVDRPHSSPQTASRYNQPFFHNSPIRQTDRMTDRPTDRQTDRWARRQLSSNTRSRSTVLIESDASNNNGEQPPPHIHVG